MVYSQYLNLYMLLCLLYHTHHCLKKVYTSIMSSSVRRHSKNFICLLENGRKNGKTCKTEYTLGFQWVKVGTIIYKNITICKLLIKL